MNARAHASKALLQELREHARSDVRRASGRVRIEAPHVLAEAIAAGWRVETCVVREGASPDVLAQLQDAVVHEASPAQLERIAGTDSAPVLVALVSPPSISLTHASAPDGSALLLDGVQDPGNVGTLIRSAYCMGVDTVVVGPGTADPFGEKALRASAGMTFHADVRRVATWDECPARGSCVRIATTAHEGIALDQFRATSPRWELALGAEGAGLSPSLASTCTVHVRIPQARGESLNVAAAAAILLWELTHPRTLGTGAHS